MSSSSVSPDPDPNCFDILIVLLKEHFQKSYVEKVSAEDKKSLKIYLCPLVANIANHNIDPDQTDPTAPLEQADHGS